MSIFGENGACILFFTVPLLYPYTERVPFKDYILQTYKWQAEKCYVCRVVGLQPSWFYQLILSVFQSNLCSLQTFFIFLFYILHM